MATIGARISKNPYPDAHQEVSWFDRLLPRVRNLRAFLSDEEIVTKLVAENGVSPEQVFLCLKAAKLLDG
jgi:hypothetical protein